MNQSVGPVTRPMPIEPTQLKVWPLACALAWIIAVDKGLSPEERDNFVCRAYREEARALPVDSLATCGKLLDYAAANPDRRLLWHPNGEVEPRQLGPDALIFPTFATEGSTVLTLALRPHSALLDGNDVSARIFGIWCLSSEVKRAWPSKTGSVASREQSCVDWLVPQMEESRSCRPRPIIEFRNKAQSKFHPLSGEAFKRAWKLAVKLADAPAWSSPGRPRKSIVNNQKAI